MKEGSLAPAHTYPVARYRLHGVVERPVAFADFAGSALRGAFGHALRALACVGHAGDGEPCPPDCAYATIFAAPPGAHAHRGGQVPNPYVIEPPAPGAFARSVGEAFDFGMVLVGPALAQLPIVLAAWRHALATDIGQQGRVRLLRVTDENGTLVLDLAEGRLHDHAQTLSIPPAPAALRSVELEFTTPVNFTRDGRPVPASQWNAHDLLMALARRALAFAPDQPDAWPGANRHALSVAAHEVRSHTHWHEQRWERYSSRQRQAMPMEGVVGTWRLDGGLTPFWPYLYLGQWLHVGKKCSFGLGRYALHLHG